MALPLLAAMAAHPWITSSVGASILGPMAGDLGSGFINWLKNNPGDARFKNNIQQDAQQAPLAQLGKAAVKSMSPVVVSTTPASTMDYLNGGEDVVLDPEGVGATNTVVGNTTQAYDPIVETAKAANILKPKKQIQKAKVITPVRTPVTASVTTDTNNSNSISNSNPVGYSTNSSLSWLNDLLPYLAVGGLAYMAGKKF